MKFTYEVNGKKLVVSSWQDQGRQAVMVNVIKDGQANSILLPFEVADELVTSLDEMLDTMSESA